MASAARLRKQLVLKPYSKKTNSALIKLKKFDIQLAYLALLTLEKIKPLSRYEKPLDNEQINLLFDVGLNVKRINRKVKTLENITQTIFSTSSSHIDMYTNLFAGTFIDKTPQTLLREGFLFGYPPCCVFQYIKKQYVKNKLEPEDQKILFHWACPNCSITSTLIADYKRVHKYIENL